MNTPPTTLLAGPAVVAMVGLATGLCTAIVTWLLSHSIARLPPEDRTWLDRPPALVRVVWWPTRWLAHVIDPLLPPGYRNRLLVRMRLAGLDYALSPAQLVAHRIVVATVGAALGGWLGTSWQLRSPWILALPGAAAGLLLTWSWFRDRMLSRRRHLLKTLPFFLDLITLCVEAGLNLSSALQQASAKGPSGPMRDEFGRVLRDVRAGKSRADALRALSDRLNESAVTQLVSAIIQAENMGMSLGPVLRAQGEQRRNERFARAEKAAMEAPVRMLLPLIAFIFPCTFLVLGFPIMVKFMQMGL